jgi:hypothetical protein
MKCRACWAEAVEHSSVPRWKVLAVACLLAAPVRCRHCHYEYYVPLWKAAEARAHRHVPVPRPHWLAREVFSRADEPEHDETLRRVA